MNLLAPIGSVQGTREQGDAALRFFIELPYLEFFIFWHFPIFENATTNDIIAIERMRMIDETNT